MCLIYYLFFQYINTMRGEMTIRDRRKCFFYVFDERENEAGSCGVINGRWTQRSSLTISSTFLSSDAAETITTSSALSILAPFDFNPVAVANLPPVSTSSLFDLVMETLNFFFFFFVRCRVAWSLVEVFFFFLHSAPKKPSNVDFITGVFGKGKGGLWSRKFQNH